MPRPKNVMEIFQLLDSSNCRECGERTCLAFAGGVFKGQRKLQECLKLDRETIMRFEPEPEGQNAIERNRDVYLQKLQDEIAGCDLVAAAERIGARFSSSRLTLKVLGKDLSVDTNGMFHADIHINPWVAVPFLSYILYGRGLSVSGSWVSFRELKDGPQRYALFQKRCEAPMKQVADTYTNLFDELVHIFNGKQVQQQFAADISVVLHPLPRVPIMICYWKPEEGLNSSLNLFFDDTADKNIDIGSLFTLASGLAQMFAKLALRHGFPDAGSPR
jgi:hypothetical protein